MLTNVLDLLVLIWVVRMVPLASTSQAPTNAFALMVGLEFTARDVPLTVIRVLPENYAVMVHVSHNIMKWATNAFATKVGPQMVKHLLVIQMLTSVP
jgi:hypothetical protein